MKDGKINIGGMVIALVLLFAGAAWAAKPNVILIMTDDQGYGDVASHGNPVIKTPAIDNLRAESVRFTDYHAAPKCTPTRGQLMTGLDAMRNGATRVCQGRSMVRAEHKMMPQYFVDAGYATGMFGKWHLGDSYPHRPRFRGFQEVVSFRAWGITSLADYFGNSYYDPMLMHNGVDKKYTGYCTDVFFDEAMKWIDKIHPNKPFFAYVATNTPHVPEIVPKKYSDPYVGKHQGHDIPSVFYGMIANIDENLAKLETFLTEKKLADNTILIFTSDNGTQNRKAQALYNMGMRDRKGSIMDGGHRVPLFIRWKNGRLQHGKDVAELAITQDILPTLAELCELDLGNAKLDGTSLVPLLTGTKATLEERMCVNQIGLTCEKWNQAVVMYDKWRLIRGNQLYHVGRDPGQKTNAAAKHPEILKSMNDFYNKWHAEAYTEFQKKRFITVGHPDAPSLTMYASDWQGDYCDNGGGLRAAKSKGYYDVLVHEAGEYEFELRRWSEDSGKSFTEAWDPTFKPNPKAKRKIVTGARPIAKAQLMVADFNKTVDTAPSDTMAKFTVSLNKGPAKITANLLDKNGVILTGAMYVKVTRK